MNAPDGEEDEDEETGEGRGVEEGDEDEEEGEGWRPAMLNRRRHAGATPPAGKSNSWAICPAKPACWDCGPRFCISRGITIPSTEEAGVKRRAPKGRGVGRDSVVNYNRSLCCDRL